MKVRFEELDTQLAERLYSELDDRYVVAVKIYGWNGRGRVDGIEVGNEKDALLALSFLIHQGDK